MYTACKICKHSFARFVYLYTLIALVCVVMMISLFYIFVGLVNCAQVEFVAYGDWGDPTKDLKDTIASIKRVCPNRSFNLLLGDNFYPSGVSSVNDPQFATFTDIVLSGTQLPHHVILGNHDYMASVAAQIQFSQVSAYWDLPSTYYRRMHVENGITVCLIMIDTIQWDSTQVAWIEAQLQAPECDTSSSWTIVSGHYPIWSSGDYSDRSYLKSDLVPLLHKYGVQLYLSGHEHLHEVFYDGSVVQVTSGAVGETRAAVQFKQHPFQIWGVSGLDVVGYLRIRMSADFVAIGIVSSRNDAEFQSFTIVRGGTKQSMFGHINWTYTNSNADHVATSAPTAFPVGSTSPPSTTATTVSNSATTIAPSTTVSPTSTTKPSTITPSTTAITASSDSATTAPENTVTSAVPGTNSETTTVKITDSTTNSVEQVTDIPGSAPHAAHAGGEDISSTEATSTEAASTEAASMEATSTESPSTAMSTNAKSSSSTIIVTIYLIITILMC